MAYNQKSAKNLEKGTKFVPGDKRRKNGRDVGIPNMKTVLNNWLEIESEGKDPAGNVLQLPMIDKVAIAVINEACNGNIRAATFIADRAFDETDDFVDIEKEEPEDELDWSVYTQDELQILTDLVAKGTKNKEDVENLILLDKNRYN